jgi:hypothetical protein
MTKKVSAKPNIATKKVAKKCDANKAACKKTVDKTAAKKPATNTFAKKAACKKTVDITAAKKTATKKVAKKAAPKKTASNKVAKKAAGKTTATKKTTALEWNVTSKVLQTAKSRAVELGFPGDKRIEFLLAKRVVKDVDQPYRFGQIKTPPNAEYKQRVQMLLGILGMATGTQAAHDAKTIPHNIGFGHFVQQSGAVWDVGSNSYVFFRDHTNFANGAKVLIQREQIFGTCGIHAPVVLQHYLVALANKGAMPTVDIPRWIRRHAAPELLEGLIFGNGVLAGQVMQAILLPNSVIPPRQFNSIPSTLVQYGPLLLPLWRVTKTFFDTNKWQHLGADPDGLNPCNPGHAMLVVGFRTSKTGAPTRLLLQNWWHDKQFVEVDEAYYNSCLGSLAVCVETPQPSIPKKFDTTQAMFSVSAVDGAGVSGVGVPVGFGY